MSVTGDLASMVMAANGSAPAPAPMPDDTEDVVEAYSFNTGIFLYLPSVLDLGSGYLIPALGRNCSQPEVHVCTAIF